MRAWVLVLVALGPACTTVDDFRCESDDECSGQFAVCQETGYCSAEDEVCETLQRYDSSAGDGLAGLCAPGLPDASLSRLRGQPLGRYFIDGADEDTAAVDVTATGADLDINFDNAEWVGASGRRGLRVIDANITGGAGHEFSASDALLAGYTQLGTGQTLTLELVLAIDPGDTAQVLMYLGNGTAVSLVRSQGLVLLTGAWPAFGAYNSWELDVGLRSVVHVVVDLGAPVPEEKVQLFVDCERVDGTMPISVDDLLVPVPEGDIRLSLGNSNPFTDTGLSAAATFYYAAVYGQALSADERQENCIELLASDDTPSPGE